MVLYACCREIITLATHTGGFEGPHANAEEAYKQSKAQKAAEIDIKIQLEEALRKLAIYETNQADDESDKEEGKNHSGTEARRGDTALLPVVLI